MPSPIRSILDRSEAAFAAASPPLRWLPAVLWYGLITWLSHAPGMGAATTASWLDRIALADWNSLLRTAAHLVVYAVLGFWLHAALVGRIRFAARKVTVSLALGALLGGLDEWHQSFVPGRAGRISDALTDIVGFALGLSLLWAWTRRRAGRPMRAAAGLGDAERAPSDRGEGGASSALATWLRGSSEDLRGLVALFLLTAVWGTTFAVIKTAVGEMLPGSLILARFGLAALVLTPVFWPRARHRRVWRAGLELGFLIWLGYTTQAIGLTFTTASRSGFITALSVVLVPALAALTGRRIAWKVWWAALMALLGVALLSWDGSPPNPGDAWTLVTALAYALFVLRLEAHARSQSTAGLTLTQLWGVIPFALLWAIWEAGRAGSSGSLGAAGGSPGQASAWGDGILAWILDAGAAFVSHWMEVPQTAWLSVLYLALVATAVTTALQTYGQRRVSAPRAALIYTLEPVFAAGVAGLVLGERLGSQGMLGAMLILVASLIGQSEDLDGVDAG